MNELYYALYSEDESIYLSQEAPALSMLMFADDVVCFADTVGRLQSQINKLQIFCEQYGMRVNTYKTKIVVFRNGGILKKCENWYNKGKQLEVVSNYRYLGGIFTSFLKWSKMKHHLVSQANKAVIMIKQFISKHKYLTVNESFFCLIKWSCLFYVMVVKYGGLRKIVMILNQYKLNFVSMFLKSILQHLLQQHLVSVDDGL